MDGLIGGGQEEEEGSGEEEVVQEQPMPTKRMRKLSSDLFDFRQCVVSRRWA